MGEGAVLRWPSGYRRKWIGRNIDCSLDRSLDSCDDAVGGAKGAGGGYGRNVDCSLDCCEGAVGTEVVDWAHCWAAAYNNMSLIVAHSWRWTFWLWVVVALERGVECEPETNGLQG